MAFPEYDLLTGRESSQIWLLPDTDLRVQNSATIPLNGITDQQAKSIFLENCSRCRRSGRGCTGILTGGSGVPHANLNMDNNFKGVPCGVDKKIELIGGPKVAELSLGKRG